MKRLLTPLMLLLPFLFLTAAGKEPKEALVKREEPKEELVAKKKEAEKLVAPSRKVKIVSHATSIAVPTIISLFFLYFIIRFPDKGFFGNEHVNKVFCSTLSSVVVFYFCLYLEAFLAKKISSKFFQGLIYFLLSGCVEFFILCIYLGKFPIDGLGTGFFFYIAALVISLKSSLLSWWIYTGINRFAS